VLLGTRLNALRCGWPTRLRAGDAADVLRGIPRGGAAMDVGNEIGPEGAASLAPALEKMTQLTSLYLGRTAMDYAQDEGNNIGPEGAASLAPALERMPQLTSLDLGGARICLWARPSGAAGSLSLVRAVGYALGCDVLWLGYALEGGRCVRRFARCVLRGCDGCRQ
jgi:hypothetical protein